MRQRADYDPNNIFDCDYEKEQAERNEALSGNISNYRVKETNCGQILEADIYPMPAHGMKKEYDKERERKKTGEAQRKINQRNVKRKISQLLHANFYSNNNVWATLTYDDKHLPEDYAGAMQDFESYKKRLKRLIARVNDYVLEKRQFCFFQSEREVISDEALHYALKEYRKGKRVKANFNIIAFYLSQNRDELMPDLKYLIVAEQSDNGRFHHHLIINFSNRDILECFWKFGTRNQARRIVPEKLHGLAGYLSKDYKCRQEYEKQFTCSRNLHIPSKTAKTYNKKASKKDAAKIANNKDYCAEWFEQHYSGYELIEPPEVRSNEYFGGYWIYARLKRRE